MWEAKEFPCSLPSCLSFAVEYVPMVMEYVPLVVELVEDFCVILSLQYDPSLLVIFFFLLSVCMTIYLYQLSNMKEKKSLWVTWTGDGYEIPWILQLYQQLLINTAISERVVTFKILPDQSL